jgi:hypothetical protein
MGVRAKLRASERGKRDEMQNEMEMEILITLQIKSDTSGEGGYFHL